MNIYDEVIYLGSFDPFHFGHKEIVDYLLSIGYHVNILLSPCTNSKQNKTDINHRKNIIRCYFKSMHNVTIKCADKYLESNDVTNMIGIMGSDAYNDRVMQQKLPKISVKSWLIVTRNCETCLNNTLENFNVDFLDNTLFKIQTSSTNIRNIIKNGLMSDEISNDVYEYCKIFGLYNNTSNNMTQKFIAINYVIVCTKEKTIGIKLFFNETDKFMLELNGYNHLSDKINIAKPISVYEGNQLCYIIYEKVNGVSLKYFLQLSTPEKIYHVGLMVGCALKTFHASNRFKFAPSDFNSNPIIKKIGLQHFEEIMHKYVKCYLHGDMSINNVCYDELSDEIYFIDPEKSIKYVDNFGNPSGIDYYEYQQFLSSVDFYSKSDNNLHLKTGFIEGYGDINKCVAIDDYWFS